MLRAAEDAQLEGTVATEEEALKLVRERFPRVELAADAEEIRAAGEGEE
jgi:hypothetical protein